MFCHHLSGLCYWIAALVSLALFGAFVSRASIKTVDVLTLKVFIELIVGAMLSILVFSHDSEECGKCSS